MQTTTVLYTSTKKPTKAKTTSKEPTSGKKIARSAAYEKRIEQKKVPTSLVPFLKKVAAKTPMQTTATKTPTKAKTTTKGPTFPSATFTTRKVAHSDPLTTHLAVVAVSESQPEPDFFKGSKSPQKTRPKEQVLLL